MSSLQSVRGNVSHIKLATVTNSYSYPENG